MSARPLCRHQPRCPGCPRFGQEGLPGAALQKLESEIARWQGPPLELHPFAGRGHRLRARLSVRGRPGALEVGIFEEGSHRLVSIVDCPVHHPELNRLVGRIVELGNALGVVPYDEPAHRGVLRAIQIAVHPTTLRAQLVLLLRTTELSAASVDDRVQRLVAELTAEAHSIFLATLPDRNNSLLGKTWLHLHGPEMLEDRVQGARVFFPPDAFGQANPVLHERAVGKIHEFSRGQARVVEYYAGVGAIGLGLGLAQQEVVFNEVGSGSLRGLRFALAQPGLPACRVLEGRAGQFADFYDEHDVVIVDPPRKGLDAELLTRLLRVAPQRLIYLSCGLPALLRECEALHRTQNYRLEHVSAWGYFPYTEHVETLMVFGAVASGAVSDGEKLRPANPKIEPGAPSM